MTRRTLCALVICTGAVCALSQVHGAWAGDEGGSQSPLIIGVGAREQSLGRTGAALSTGCDALFWNPARLALSEWPEVSLYHSRLFVDASIYHATFVTYPTLDFGSFALGYQRLGVSEIEERDERNRLLGNFETGESNLMIGYGRRLSPAMSIGGALRIVQQSVAGEGDVGIGLDLGLSHERGFGSHNWLALGVNLQNALEPKLQIDQDSVADPRSLKLGSAYTHLFNGINWTTALDVDLTAVRSARFGLGMEASYMNAFSIRAGFDDGSPAFGIGASYRFLRLDYALQESEGLPHTDRISLLLKVGHSVGERIAVRNAERESRVAEELARLLADRETQARLQARQEADAAYQSQNFEDALRLYRRALLLAPDDAEIQQRTAAAELELTLGRTAALLKEGRAAEAATEFQGVLERWPNDPRAQQGLEIARTQLRKAADRVQQLNVLFKQALGSYSEGDYGIAEVTLGELLRLEPQHELGRELLVRLRATRQARGNEALAQAHSAAEAHDYKSALANLAAARKLLGTRSDFSQLEADWQRAQDTKSRTPAATAVAAQRSRSEAEDTAPPLPRRRSLTAEERRELENKYQAGLRAFSGGDFQRAIRNWRAVWLDDPGYEAVGDYLIKAYLFEGVELYGRGQYEAALDRCRRVLEIDPNNDKAQRYLSRIQEEQQELEEINSNASE